MSESSRSISRLPMSLELAMLGATALLVLVSCVAATATLAIMLHPLRDR